jgi:hypothetical protein
MLRKAIALAMLCLTLLLCGLDTSAVGAPAESDTALHAVVHGHDSGVRGHVDDLAAAAFVALVSLVLVMAPQMGRRSVGRMSLAEDAMPVVGWFTSHAERGPPALA